MENLSFIDSATVYVSQKQILIQHVRHDNEPVLSICRISGLIRYGLTPFIENYVTYSIKGIVGIKHLAKRSYLIVITETSLVGSVCGHDVYKIENVLLIPFRNVDEDGRVLKQDEWEEIYINMLYKVLKTPNFYVSYTYDLTNSLQKNLARQANLKKLGDKYGFSECDKRFFWNGHLIQQFDLANPCVAKYLPIMIHGFISINENALGPGLNWSLISRRSVRRAGTRYHSRGIDGEGNVSNFVETEQILDKNETLLSFVQIRGSIPLFWGQKPGYVYKPPIEVDCLSNHEAAMEKHIKELQDIYGQVSIACLIDRRGHEGILARHFGESINSIQKYINVQYHYFDFHQECSKMRWHRLSILLERLEEEIDSYGFFCFTNNEVVKSQTGVIRSNCIDSLDRTNVIQSMIAQYVLQVHLAVFNHKTRIIGLHLFPKFTDTFKNAWANNADALSIQYAGTPALKTDFTRTGKRTQFGIVKDGFNSIVRYVYNNYLDTYRQDAIDLYLGKDYEGIPSPLYQPMQLASFSSTLPAIVIMITLVGLYLYFRWDLLK